jgi:hypothetical protein
VCATILLQESCAYTTDHDPRWETSERKLKEIPITVRRIQFLNGKELIAEVYIQ